MKIKKHFAAFVVAFLAIFITSCGSKNSSDTFEVTVDNTTIGGKLSNYFLLVDKTYKYKTGIIDEVTVELKCIKPLPENMEAYIGIEVLDEDGTVITVCKPDGWAFSDDEVLQQATPDQIVTIKIENHENVGDEKPSKIRLSSIVNEKEEPESVSYPSESDNDFSEEESYSTSNDDDDDDYGSSTSSGSEDWDALLDSYDSYVTKYISLVKKAANGDVTALAEYASLMQKAQEYSEKMENAQSDMSVSQWARYMKITNKMTKAALEMQ